MSVPSQVTRTTVQLVRREFEKGRSETDPDKIEALKSKYVRFAIRGLSNYLVLANSSKDQRLRDAMNKTQAPPSSDGPEQADGSADNAGVENVTKKLALQLEAGDFYGALQMYKTLFMRFLKGDEPDAAQQEKVAALALEAALRLIAHDQNTAATEM
ncbi:hypothetical protein BBJ28_00009000, partial [Nothophytophthora sp. Chile5]